MYLRYVSLAIIVVAAVTVSLVYVSQPSYCEAQYTDIRSEIEEANFCEVDADCKTLVLGGSYIEFGCYHFINQEVDEQQFYERMSTYNERCVDVINECAPAPEPSCVDNVCVYAGS